MVWHARSTAAVVASCDHHRHAARCQIIERRLKRVLAWRRGARAQRPAEVRLNRVRRSCSRGFRTLQAMGATYHPSLQQLSVRLATSGADINRCIIQWHPGLDARCHPAVFNCYVARQQRHGN